MNLFTRPTMIASMLTALTMLVIFAGVSLATPSDDDTAAVTKKKPIFSKKQKREVNRLIAAALKKKVGPTGAAGPAGPAVAPAAFTATNGSTASLTPTHQTLATKALAPGKYAINATVSSLFYTGSFSAYLECKGIVDSTTAATSSTTATGSSFFNSVIGAVALSVPLTFTVDSTSASAVRIDCAAWDADGAANVAVPTGAAKLIAIQVGSIN